MNQKQRLDAMSVPGFSVSDRGKGAETPMMGNYLMGLVAFAITGLAITAILVGKDVPQTGMAAYSINGQIISSGHYSLDLSKPIFVRGEVPVCPTEDALTTYSPANPGGCTIMSSGEPAGLLGIVTNGMRQPTFEMQMKTPTGTVRGWIDYNDLTN